MEFHHKSVLLDECIQGLNIKPDGIYLDGTLGGAGHSSQIGPAAYHRPPDRCRPDQVALEARPTACAVERAGHPGAFQL